MTILKFDNHPPIRLSDYTQSVRLRSKYAHLDFGADRVILYGPTASKRYVCYHYSKGAYDGDVSSRTLIALGSIQEIADSLNCEEYQDAHNALCESFPELVEVVE